jgi:phosphoenolpyruvate carboxykinase (ATP)
MTAQTRFQADAPSLLRLAPAFRNLGPARLYEEALRRGEAALTESGALVVETAPHTGRSPADKFIVCDSSTKDTVWWGANQPMAPAAFARLHADMAAHAQQLGLYAQDLHAGADTRRRLNVRVYSELAWHSLFIRNLLIRPSPEAPPGPADLTILDLPSFKADPDRHGCRSQTVIALDFARGLALIGGTKYAGEIKKAVFTFLNYLMPAQGVLPMHCAANDHASGAAVFFGLSGTGKTTLSADPERALIGDDEHGWDDAGLFNFEGGCYAKAIRLSAECEPEIHAASTRFGVVMENVGMDSTGRVDFDDDTKTENTRIAYPLDFIPGACRAGRAAHPKNVVMLTCDAFGVLPPIARLDTAQAIYHFLSGYTARVAGTERGVREPQAVFSTCFGAPFMPRHPAAYGRLLRERLLLHNTNCWLVNTGWTGGGYGDGRRMPIAVTRALLRAALDGAFDGAEFRRDPRFGFLIPRAAPGIDAALLDPAPTWSSPASYATAAEKLTQMFRENFAAFAPFVDAATRVAGPCAG